MLNPASPLVPLTAASPADPGMAQRDLVAVFAMQALIGRVKTLFDPEGRKSIAEEAYKIADAMVKASKPLQGTKIDSN